MKKILIKLVHASNTLLNHEITFHFKEHDKISANFLSDITFGLRL